MKTILAAAASSVALLGAASAMDLVKPGSVAPETKTQAFVAGKIAMSTEDRLALAYPAPSRAIMARLAGLDFSANLDEGAVKNERVFAFDRQDDDPTAPIDAGRPVFGLQYEF